MVVVLAIGSVAGGGCGKLYDIKQGTTDVGGVPFYVKTAVCRQEQVFLETLFRITLVETTGTRKEVVGSKVVTAKDYHAARDLRTKPEETLRALQDVTGTLRAFASQDLLRASNTAATETRVDYAKTFYVNVNKPFIGSGSATAKLAGDGTLTELTAEVEDTTASALLDLLPVNAFLTSRFAPEAVDRTPIGVEVEPVLVRHTLFKYTEETRVNECEPAGTNLDPSTKGVHYRREVVEAGGGGAKGDDANTVKVSGTVVLPKKEEKKE